MSTDEERDPLATQARKRLSDSDQRIEDVLRGALSYDALCSEEQAVVRRAWDRSIRQRMSELRLDLRFADQGRPYVELDDKGRVRFVDPRSEPTC